MGSKKVVQAPAPTAEELELRRAQAELLRQQSEILRDQQRQYELLAPFVYSSMGLKPIYDKTGKLTGFEKLATETEADKLRQAIELELLKRSERALKGELDVSPTLTRELSEQEQTLKEILRRQLGTGYATSTPGIEALARQAAYATELREQARRGELTLSEQLSLARAGERRAQTAFLAGGGGTAPAFGQIMSGYGLTAQGYSAPIAAFAADREAQFRANVLNAQKPGWGAALGTVIGGIVGSIIPGIGTALGAALGGALGGATSGTPNVTVQYQTK